MNRRDFFTTLAAPAVVALVAASATTLQAQVGPTMTQVPGKELLYEDTRGRQFRMMQADRDVRAGTLVADPRNQAIGVAAADIPTGHWGFVQVRGPATAELLL